MIGIAIAIGPCGAFGSVHVVESDFFVTLGALNVKAIAIVAAPIDEGAIFPDLELVG